MAEDIFTKDKYTRRITPMKDYVEQVSMYLSKITGDDENTTKKWLMDKIMSKSFPNQKDPNVIFYERNEYGDKEKKVEPLSRYIKTINDNNYILAPTFTCYLPPTVKKSLLVEFLFDNTAKRSVAKKKAFKLRAEGDKEGFVRYNNEQQGLKIYNNSVSGSFVTKSSALHNPTAHSTLTSTTRCVASLGNLTNERIITGNRLYHTAKVTINNLISVVKLTDMDSFSAVVNKYNLHIPTVEECMEVVRYSSRLYWYSKEWEDLIKRYISSLEGMERAAICYIGDLYHTRKFNNGFMREFIEDLSKKVTDVTYDNPLELIDTIPEGILNLAHHVCSDIIMGYGKDYKRMHNDGILNTLVATSIHEMEVLKKYEDFIQAVLITDNLPPSKSYIKSMLRRAVVLSDTDSTCASYQDWVEWYFGNILFTSEGTAVSAAVMTLATQTIAHVLRTLSANINVPDENRNLLAMKNEFYWDVMTPMNVSKHYIANVRIQEGSVFPEPDQEIKGMQLIASSAPKPIQKDMYDFIVQLHEEITANKGINLTDKIKHVADVERYIIEELKSGNVLFYNTGKVKEAEAYKNGATGSPYMYHIFWEEVFKDTYGSIDKPTYITIKVPTILSSKKKIADWVRTIEDAGFKERLLQYIEKYNKTQINIINLNINYVVDKGLPDVIKDIVDYKKTVLNILHPYYMLLESIGYYKKPNHMLSELGY